MRIRYFVFALLITLSGCAQRAPLGMMPGSDGLLYGSAVEKNIVVDSSQFSDNSIKLSIRNTSGDFNLDIHSMKHSLERRLSEKGYAPTDSNNFLIKYDVNVLYSGHIRKDLASDFAFLGGAAGAIAGYRTDESAGTAIGLLGGATIGAILGSHISDDTYIVITEVTLAVKDKNTGIVKKTIVFDSSPKLQEENKSGITRFSDVVKNRVSVYAGGRNVSQTMIIDGVRDRLERILSDII